MPSVTPGDILTVTAAPRAAPAARALAAWRVGQVLEALVVRVDGPARAWLRVGAAEVPVRTHAPLTPGAHLTLRVASTRPALTLEPVRPAAPEAGRAPEAATVPTAWRLALPRQRPLAEALGRALAASRGGAAALRQAAEPLQALAVRLPVPATLTRPEELAAAVAASGLFLEARLARGEAPPPGDLKLALARAAAALRAAAGEPPAARAATSKPDPSRRDAGEAGPARVTEGQEAPPAPAPRGTEAARQDRAAPRTPFPAGGGVPAREAADAAEAALARITARQLESLPRGGDEAPRWSLELPVRLADGRLAGLHLRIGDERGRRGRSGDGRRWQVRLALDLPDGASVHAAVALAGRRVGVRLLTPNAVLARALAEGLPRLAEALRRGGLEPGVLESRAGRPAADEDPARLQAPGLVDLEA